jgi:hypothetical protein
VSLGPYTPTTSVVGVGDEQTEVTHRGTMVVREAAHIGSRLPLPDALIIPKQRLNLISMGKLDVAGHRFTVDSGKMICVDKMSNQVIFVAVLESDGLYHIKKIQSSYALTKSSPLPFTSKESDEVEVPPKVWKSIIYFLLQKQKLAGRKLTLLEPFFCKGTSTRVLSGVGFNMCIPENLDFLDPLGPRQGSEYDFIVTCPPFSQNRHFFKRLEF